MTDQVKRRIAITMARAIVGFQLAILTAALYGTVGAGVGIYMAIRLRGKE